MARKQDIRWLKQDIQASTSTLKSLTMSHGVFGEGDPAGAEIEKIYSAALANLHKNLQDTGRKVGSVGEVTPVGIAKQYDRIDKEHS